MTVAAGSVWGGVTRLAVGVRRILPHGRVLPENEWWPRHRVILVILWVHAVGIPVFGLVRGFSLAHSLWETAAIAASAVVATSARGDRRVRAGAATIGLLTSSAVITHLSGGTIEAHFHFFVMVPLVALYQDWVPFSLAIAYVLVHHGLVGALDPDSVYNHAAAIRHPWRWASIHAAFISGISAVCLAAWRLNESALEQRRQAEDDMHHALSALSATLDSTADGILVVNEEGKITQFNNKFLEMWRIPESVVQSRDDDAALAFVLDQLKDPEGFLAKVRELYGDAQGESLDELEFKDGRVFERYSHPQLVGERSVGRVWSFRDITDRKTTELALREALRRDQEAVRRLEELDEAKNVFLTALSHEVRTPLTSISGLASTLATGGERLTLEQRLDLLGRLTRNADRLQALLLNLLDLDRISRGVLEPRRKLTDLGELVHRVVETFSGSAQEIEVDVKEVSAFVDPGMIERVMENLVANALKHTPRGTPVAVRLRATPGGVLLVVEDRGPGVPDELKEAIFEPFKQGNTSLHSPGTGVGLSLVSKFAELHGGRAWVEDRSGGGASFCVVLPAIGPASEPAREGTTRVSA